jgi:hypothetical protein
MAVLQSIQTGNFLDASTWGLVDSTSYLDSRTTEQALSPTETSATTAFTPGAITVAGVALQVGTRVATPTGTMTVRLFNNTAGTTVKNVVINVADLPNTNGTLNGGFIGWTYFKFDSNVTLIAGNQYSVRAFVSVSSTVTVYRNATTNNWSRALVTETTQAPAATDTVITSGAYTAAGVNTSVTVTMNSTSLATQYGPCYVGSNGTFNYGVDAATNYGLRLNGDVIIGRGATFTIGTVANPIHQTSTAILEINCASALQFGILNYGTLETKHTNTVLHRALLNADITTGATTMTTNVSTGWKQNDSIVIPSTTRTTTHHERRVLSSDASGTTLTIPAISNPHDGNAAIFIQADLANLTRSIKIRSVNTTFKTRFRQGLQGITTFFDVEFFELGTNSHFSGTLTYAGTFNVQQCTFWQTASPGTSTLLSNINTTTYTLSNNVFYNYSEIQGTLNDNNLLIGFAGFAAHFGGSIGNNNVLSSCAQAASQNPPLTGTTGNRYYANGGNGGIYMSSNSAAFTVSNYVFFNNTVAIRYVSSGNTIATDRTSFEKFENCYFYGNTDNISILASGSGLGMNPLRKLWFNNCFFWAGKTGLLTLIGYSPIPNDYTHFTNCTFGRRPDGVESNFTTSCVRGGQVGTTFTNCLFSGIEAAFASTNILTSVNGFNGITSLKHDQITNEYRQYQSNGFIQNDNIITYNGLPTIRIKPEVTTNKTFSNPVRIAVSSENTCTVSVAIRKSVVGDGAVYNGNQPRLMYAFNPLAGNLEETVAVSATNAANGAWEILTYTTPVVSHDSVLEFYIDCDGTAGWINIDDFKTTTSNDTRGMKYWSSIGVYSEPDWRRPGGTVTFVT